MGDIEVDEQILEDEQANDGGDTIIDKKNRIKEINLEIKELLEERDELEREIEDLNEDLTTSK